MANLYCTATHTGKGFFTHQDRRDFYLSGGRLGYGLGTIWVVSDNSKGEAWINRVNGTLKTKAEAQAQVDEERETAQATWDALPADAKEKERTRPEKYTLP